MTRNLERRIANYEFKQSYRTYRMKLGFVKVRAGNRGSPYSLCLFTQQAKCKKLKSSSSHNGSMFRRLLKVTSLISVR